MAKGAKKKSAKKTANIFYDRNARPGVLTIRPTYKPESKKKVEKKK